MAAAGVRAIVPGRHCPKCEGPLSLTSRTAFQQVCDGHDPVCVRRTDSLLAAVRIVLDPARKAKREEAKIAAKTQQAVDEVSARWRQSQREIIQETYGVVSRRRSANCPSGSVIFSTAVDMTQVLRDMARVGWTVDPADLAVLSPYRRETIRRFGDYNTDGFHIPPAPVDPHLDITIPPKAQPRRRHGT